MVQYTLENTIILYVFETLLAGLILLVCTWESLRSPGRRDRAPLAVAFFFFSGFVLTRSLFSIGLSVGSRLLDRSWPFFVICALETVSLACLLFWLAPSQRWKRAVMIAALVLIPAHVAYRVLHSSQAGFTFEPSYHGGPWHLALVLAAAFLARKAFPHRWSFIQVGVLFFAGSYLAETLFDLLLPRSAVWLWDLQHVAKILGLLSFALHLDREGAHIYLQFFVRLNLIFILSASVFMLLLSETQRKQYLDFSASQTEELAEFLRGHVIYFYVRGLDPRAILEREEINRKIVSELGRVPGLKQVKMEVSDQQLVMAIDPAGSISYRLGRGLFFRQDHSIYDYSDKAVTVLRMPITLQGNLIGFVQFDEDLLVLSHRIAEQMQLIFMSFTVVVFVTLGALGFIMSKAQRTIRQQYQALQEKQDELVQASRLASIGELVDGVAHEVNNPTGVILLRSECALAALPSDSAPSVREDLEEIRSQAGRMTRLVRMLLVFSRAAPMCVGPVDLNQVVRRSLDLISAYLGITGIRVTLDLAPELPLIRGDVNRLEQVIVNLVKNAADAMSQGGLLSCHTFVDDQFAILTVTDTGIGMAPEVMEKIFTPFFTTKAPERGTGLGLSISYGIVRDHGGRIEVQSESHRGSVFTVFLPLQGR